MTNNAMTCNCSSVQKYLNDPRSNQGLGYGDMERSKLKINGLLPYQKRNENQQVAVCKENLKLYTNPLHQYIYLMSLLDRNERLFYRLLSENVHDLMPLVYTPTVGEACQKYSLLYQKPKGLFITIDDKGQVSEVLNNWPTKDVKAIVVTDGERILGLGDLGANGMGIPVGKLALYTALAKVNPSSCLPITLDVGTNNHTLLADEMYIGKKHQRITGKEYDEFIDEFMQSVVKRFGPNTLIQFEDFGNQNAFRLLEKYQDSYCTFNDDIQGTASVAVAGLLSALKITKKRLSDNIILFQGAGEASLGIANLCVITMMKEGTSLEKARSKIFLVDSKGLIVKNRPEGNINKHKDVYAKDMNPIRNLEDVVKTLKPSVLIGAAAIGGAFNRSILESMAEYNERPIIFALSNPTSKAECTAEDAYRRTKGKAIFASGSPFDVVEYEGKKFHPGQGNNSYIFPGVALAAICAGIKPIDDECFYIAAKTLSDLVTNGDLDSGNVYPALSTIQNCSFKIAVELTKYAYDSGIAAIQPRPNSIEEYIRKHLYDYSYDSVQPKL